MAEFNQNSSDLPKFCLSFIRTPLMFIRINMVCNFAGHSAVLLRRICKVFLASVAFQFSIGNIKWLCYKYSFTDLDEKLQLINLRKLIAGPATLAKTTLVMWTLLTIEILNTGTPEILGHWNMELPEILGHLTYWDNLKYWDTWNIGTLKYWDNLKYWDAWNIETPKLLQY